MDLGIIAKTIAKISSPIPTPVLYWGFIAIIVIVMGVIFKKMLDMRGD